MFDKLDDILFRLEEVLNQLNEPGVANDPGMFQKLMKEQAELQPIADAYQEYKNCEQTIEDSVAMLEEEHDEEMREMLKEELSGAKKRVEEGSATVTENADGTKTVTCHGIKRGRHLPLGDVQRCAMDVLKYLMSSLAWDDMMASMEEQEKA